MDCLFVLDNIGHVGSEDEAGMLLRKKPLKYVGGRNGVCGNRRPADKK